MQIKLQSIIFYAIYNYIIINYMFIKQIKNRIFLNITENILNFFRKMRLFCSSKFKKYVITISGNQRLIKPTK